MVTISAMGRGWRFFMSNPTRKMHRLNRGKAIKKGTPFRRLLPLGNGYAIHATKGTVHEESVLTYRAKYLLDQATKA